MKIINLSGFSLGWSVFKNAFFHQGPFTHNIYNICCCCCCCCNQTLLFYDWCECVSVLGTATHSLRDNLDIWQWSCITGHLSLQIFRVLLPTNSHHTEGISAKKPPTNSGCLSMNVKSASGSDARVYWCIKRFAFCLNANIFFIDQNYVLLIFN